MTYILVENVKNWHVLCKLFLISKCSAWSANRALDQFSPLPFCVMTTFEHNYNPHIIYDASCIAKEFGYNRELRRFMQLSITSDRFHEVNHKSCSNSFKTSEYNQLEKINSEACEQTNSSLRRVTSSTTFMSPTMYMRSLTLFMADINISANKFKKKYFKVIRRKW